MLLLFQRSKKNQSVHKIKTRKTISSGQDAYERLDIHDVMRKNTQLILYAPRTIKLQAIHIQYKMRNCTHLFSCNEHLLFCTVIFYHDSLHWKDTAMEMEMDRHILYDYTHYHVQSWSAPHRFCIKLCVYLFLFFFLAIVFGNVNKYLSMSSLGFV